MFELESDPEFESRQPDEPQQQMHTGWDRGLFGTVGDSHEISPAQG